MKFADKIRTINFAGKRGPKRTTDHLDIGTATTTEHWDDRVDVRIDVDTMHVKAPKVVDHG